MDLPRKSRYLRNVYSQQTRALDGLIGLDSVVAGLEQLAETSAFFLDLSIFRSEGDDLSGQFGVLLGHLPALERLVSKIRVADGSALGQEGVGYLGHSTGIL